ncbi:potassium-transporting ATPase subunit KdpC [Propionispora vibrioides]|uniref:Potassium-transporting ATPase KdpC subunit n=1 Tax=Propionispora vibrioides TaxID=112903 RepID=A0A1H8VZ51_9FIRM|nr:potassium-transporting ATPase subunit KdpC [Propionispora vibrioides]SEP20656.1 K+-transporting ATPase ATPase C chain [Propionispora vibrioides]
MWKWVVTGLRMLAVFTLLTGFVYPLLVTGVAQLLFPAQANGSLVTKNGSPVGSRLIGQNFTGDKYFHGRPSAAGQDGYDGTASAGSNLGPTNQALLQAVAERLSQVRQENGLSQAAPVPADLVLASASGLDPHITPAAAYLQAARVARTRGRDVAEVERLIEAKTEGRLASVLGEERVNVLELNLALDESI